MERLSFEEAKRLSIKKWQMHVNCNGFDMCVGKDEELGKLICTCGFCERWQMQCQHCEFAKVTGACGYVNSSYNKWFSNRTKYKAQKILDVIKNLEEQ